MSLYTVEIRRVENGFLLRYTRDGLHKEMVFLSWAALCDWLKEQVT